MATANSSAQLLPAGRLYEVLQYYYAPAGASAIQSNINNLYGFLGRVTPWDDDNNPPIPTQDDYSVKQYFKDIIAAKLITSSDVGAVIPRRDWESGIVYDYYDDTVNMLEQSSDGLTVKNFYVRNKFDQIFKCLWNNNGAESINEPQFLPGTFDNTFLVKTADGYKWKFMYSLDAGLKQKFFDTNWMPVPVGVSIPNPVSTYAAQGSIDVINITTVGEGYTSGGVTINIVGDGQGAEAIPLVNAAGYLYDVSMANTGQGYTFAQISIEPKVGYDAPTVVAEAFAPISPIAGHGYDPISELGCNHVMVGIEFIESENSKLSTNMTYHQIGLLIDPVSVQSVSQNPPTLANTSFYDATTHLFVSPGTGEFTSGQVIYQGASQTNFSFIGRIASFDPASNVVKVINTIGTPTKNQALIQDPNGPVAGAIRTILDVQDPDFITFSGYMTYIENRTGVVRSADGTEQFRIVLRF
jgi:hypothetical protein